MRFSLSREALLKPLQQVVNVVERRQTLPVLANLLVQVDNSALSLTGTDLEVEMVARSAVDDAQNGETTIPARKLFEIVRALPDGAKVSVSQAGDKVTVQAGRSRFTLATLPSNASFSGALASRAFRPERSPDSIATKSLALIEPSTRSPRQSNCPVAANEREIDGHASDKSISPSVSETWFEASS
jgi:hypothetical protein